MAWYTPYQYNGTPTAAPAPKPVAPVAAPAPTPPPPVPPPPSPTDLYKAFSAVAPPPTPINPYQLPQVAPPPQVVAPVVAAPPPIVAATVQAPEGSYDNFEKAFYESAYNPVQRALDLQRAADEKSLKAQLANSGLAESGVGVAAQGKLGAQYAERGMSASQQAASQAAQARYGAEIDAAAKNADYAQQAGILNAQNALQLGIANAGYNLEAQKINASNILQGNIANAQGYLQAMGINAQAAAAYRGDFLKFYDVNAELSAKAASDIFNYYLQSRKINNDFTIAQQNAQLESQKLDLQRQLGFGQLSVDQQKNQISAADAYATAASKNGAYYGSRALGPLAGFAGATPPQTPSMFDLYSDPNLRFGF